MRRTVNRDWGVAATEVFRLRFWFEWRAVGAVMAAPASGFKRASECGLLPKHFWCDDIRLIFCAVAVLSERRALSGDVEIDKHAVARLSLIALANDNYWEDTPTDWESMRWNPEKLDALFDSYPAFSAGPVNDLIRIYATLRDVEEYFNHGQRLLEGLLMDMRQPRYALEAA